MPVAATISSGFEPAFFMMTKRFFQHSILFVIACFTACTSNNQNQNFRGNAVIPSIEAVQARFGSLPLEERFSGTVIAENQVDVYPEVSGVVDRVVVQNGDRVSRGQPLLYLRDADRRERLNHAQAGLDVAKARVEQAEASYLQTETQHNRIRTLADQQLTSQAEMDNSTAQLAQARANLSLAQAQMSQAASLVEEEQLNVSRTAVRSPVDGLVGQRMAEPGQLINTNSRLFTVGNPGKVRISIVLAERVMGYIRENMSVRISSTALGDSVISGSITRISPFLDPVTHTTTADIEISNPGRALIPGMFVSVDVLYGESENAVLVPNSAVYRHPLTGLEGVYVATSLGTEIAPVTDVAADGPPVLTEATPVEFVEVKILAKGREMSGVTGINGGAWVTTVGQNLLAGGAGQARVRTVTWDRILGLQSLTEEGFLEQVIQKPGNTP